MKKAIENLGLHLTLLLYKEGADDQAYDEIFESLKRAKERAKNIPEEEHNLKHTIDTDSMRLLVGDEHRSSLSQGTICKTKTH